MAVVYLGYEALVRRYRLHVPPLRCVYAATERSVESRTIDAMGEERIELPLRNVRDPDSLIGQLSFALKREHLDLTVLGALFQQPEAIQAIQAWLLDKPSSKYSRMAGHLASWLTGHSFDFKLPSGSPRVLLLDPGQYVVGPIVPDLQFGVLNNVLGDRWFSPLIRRTATLERWLASGMAASIGQALKTIEPEMMARAADYLYLSETQSTYRIEAEEPDSRRTGRFRQLLEHAGAPGELNEQQFGDWQAMILDPRMAEYHYRDGQNWLSRTGRLKNIADFIPAPADLVRPMMESVARVAQLAGKELDAVLAATCASFGFVFVHPFWDGNGRLHRFLLHHILRQSGFTPADIVLPISARMLNQLDKYAALLKRYSRPRTDLVDYELDADSATIYVRSAQPLWLYAYHDFTEICEFIYECCQACVEEDLQAEVEYLRAHDATLSDLETWLDMRQAALHTLIDVIVQNNGTLSKRKHKLAEGLSEAAIVRIESTVAKHFASYIDARA